ncbi:MULTISPECIES: hypothetical protein [Tenacibaculum]|uniref:hypothetical protein n=1 Tax=Tenacibaculum TaxID=104267 RepID=UPI00064A7B36|nr:hypothetical protein [Tenacibaculum mesophilum]
MALFNLDIERFILAQKEKGKLLRGIACIQYPVYCVHSEIKDESPGPLDELDTGIAKLFNQVTNNHSVIANILSVKEKGVRDRIKYFHDNKYLTPDKNQLSQLGFNTLIKLTEKKVINRSYDFFIDGITFQPLPSQLYYKKYRQAMFEEFECNFYTDNKGNIRTEKPFSPDIIHTPFNPTKVNDAIINVEKDKRDSLSIPQGLIAINEMIFTKMSLPVLIGLFDKGGEPVKELINGFDSLGSYDDIKQFEVNLEKRIKNLEFRLDSWKDKNTEEIRYNFNSNWNEIDVKNDEDKIFWVSKQDLKEALETEYEIENIPLNNIITDKNEIGLMIDKELLNKTSNKRVLINNLKRGRDYLLKNNYFNTGVWVTFFNFKTECNYTIELLEIIKFIDNAKEKDLKIDHYVSRLLTYPYFREMLIFLEEFKLLEKIDIKLTMHQVNHDK